MRALFAFSVILFSNLAVSPARAAVFNPPPQFAEGTRFIASLDRLQTCSVVKQPDGSEEVMGGHGYGDCALSSSQDYVLGAFRVSGACSGRAGSASLPNYYTCNFSFAQGTDALGQSCNFPAIDTPVDPKLPWQLRDRDFNFRGNFATLDRCVKAIDPSIPDTPVTNAHEGDIASTCGKAKFDWYTISGGHGVAEK